MASVVVTVFETDSGDFHREVEDCLQPDQRQEEEVYPSRDAVVHRELAAHSVS
jgi:hypothetical protein